MLEICRCLFEQWNSNVRYCHWKSNEHLYEGLIGQTDLDVFVLPEDQSKAEKCLRNCSCVKVIPQKGCRYPYVDEWIGFDKKTGKLIHIHLHYQIITGRKYNKEYIFPINNLAIDNRVLDKIYNVYIIEPALEIIILYCRIVLKAENKRSIQPDLDLRKEINYLKSKMDPYRLSHLCTSFFCGKGDVVFKSINQTNLTREDWYVLYNIVKDWLEPYKKYSSFKAQFFFYYHKSRIRVQSFLKEKCGFILINKKTLHKGFSVCFIGQDGCGKSTNTITIKKWLNWKIAAERFYLGSGDHYNGILKTFIAKSRKKSSNKIHVEESIKTNSNTPRALKKWFGYFLISYNLFLYARHSYKTIKKANKYVDKGGIALYDRFPQDQIAGYYDGPKIDVQCFRYNSSWFVKLLSSCEKYYIKKAQAYQPNLLFKLYLSPDESLRRKPEEDIDVIKKKALATKILTFEKSKTIEISAEQPFETELIEIKNYIWKYIFDNDN